MTQQTRRVVFAPYALRVSAPRHMAEAFDSFCILPEGSRFRARPSDVIVNWGRTNLPDYAAGVVLNPPELVSVCVNKLQTFQAFAEHNVPTVEWTTDVQVAGDWVRSGSHVIGRETLTGRGGAGIRIFWTPPIPENRCRLFTKYAKRKHEYRVHVLRGRVIDAQQKRRRNGAERTPLTSMIRSYDNGWVFCRGGVVVPEVVKNAAIAAVESLGLDFGGVDVGYNIHHDRAYVYEVNSAPGIEGSTIDNYVNAIKELL